MNYFFGFENTLSHNIDYFFNTNHLFLIFVVASIVLGCTFLFNGKIQKEKSIKATKIFFAILLFVLEVGRTIYKYLKHLNGGGTAGNFNWWWNISFQMCAIMCWTTIITLILSVVLKKENKFLQMLYNILFGCALLGGVLTFLYPDCMSENYPFLHFINIQTVLVHALLIFVPIYLIRTKDFRVDIKNIWKVTVGYVFIGCVAMTASLISGNNFAYSLKFGLIDLGLPFPWHLPILLILLTAIDALLYGSFEVVRLIKARCKKSDDQKVEKVEKPKRNVLGLTMHILSLVSAVLFGALIMLGTASLIGNTKTALGIFCLIGLVYMILMLIFAEKVSKHYIDSNLDKDNKAKHITFIVLTFVFAMPVGIVYLTRYLSEK